jgi:hypothetical protein
LNGAGGAILICATSIREKEMLAYKTRRRLAMLALVVGLPLYIVVSVTIVNWAEMRWGRMPILLELLVYVGLGVLWAYPLKPIFKGVGKEDPDA